MTLTGLPGYCQVTWYQEVAVLSVTVYLHLKAVSTPVFAGLANRIGLKFSLMVCLICYFLGVVGCSLSFLAGSMVVLILMRALQGMGLVSR